jgi:hypothetical protein
MGAPIKFPATPFRIGKVRVLFSPFRGDTMTDEAPTPWVPGSDDAILFTITHALRFDGRKGTRQADELIARMAAERIMQALKRAYVITPKPPQPWQRSDQLPKMGDDR